MFKYKGIAVVVNFSVRWVEVSSVCVIVVVCSRWSSKSRVLRMLMMMMMLFFMSFFPFPLIFVLGVFFFFLFDFVCLVSYSFVFSTCSSITSVYSTLQTAVAHKDHHVCRPRQGRRKGVRQVLVNSERKRGGKGSRHTCPHTEGTIKSFVLLQ